ncbi:hypothetical protein JW796_02100 [Candidatus Dojkabacteria bacterium]|nr:hypothetical protein [Candidatus Dojkabacteria bacterium]
MIKKTAAFLVAVLFLIGVLPVQAINGSQSKSISGVPAVGSFKGVSAGNQTVFSSSFNVSSISSSAQVHSATLSITQANGALGNSTFDLVEKRNGITLGTKVLSNSGNTHIFSGINDVINDWISDPSANQGFSFSASNLDADDNISMTGITLNVTYYFEDTVPPVISNVKASSITNTSVRITWKTDEVSLGYVDYGLSKSYGLAVVGNDYIVDHAVMINGLKPGSLYHYRVRGKDSSGNESVTGDFTFTTTGEKEEDSVQDEVIVKQKLLPPNDLRYEVNEIDGSFAVVLKWDKSNTEDIDGYRVYRAVDERFPAELYIQLDREIYQFSDRNIEKDKTYFYIVRAYSNKEESSDSNEIVVKVEEETVISKVPIKPGNQAFLMKLGAVNVAAFSLVALGYFLIRRFKRKKKKTESKKSL